MSRLQAAMPPSHNREETLFALVLEKPADKRPAFLDVICEGDWSLRRRLEELLAAHDQENLTPLPKAPVFETTVKLKRPPSEDDAVGKTIGRYRLLEQIGEGGCGVVYVAEQTEPVRRRVALKVIKLGMDTKQVVARFEAERQALAMMDHPNIARVLDAGTTETGRPYFVMELVRGIRITDYCDQSHLTTTERLNLVIKVCQAIQHAHQKGIIHRDIKPSNILVTLHDGVAVPKVIDFGIAKATEGRLTDATVYTQLHQFIGTPAYMSPEQAEMSGLDIDTRSDIYSIGVLLYELLVGSTPFDGSLLMISGVDAMRKTIRESEPVRPSTRFATLKGQALTIAAKHRSADSSKVVHQLRGDLDWIVMKCLEKDRTRRYETANGLALDLQRHLNNEPVLARPPSTTYRLQKAFRRYKLVCIAGIVVLLALFVGLGSATIMYFREHAALIGEQQQRVEAQVAQKVAETAQEKASASQQRARRLLYAEDMNLAQQALKLNNLGRARRLIDRQRPQPGEQDLRGWEWRYLWSQTRADEHEIFLAGTKRLLSPLSFNADGQYLAREEDGTTIVTDLISRRTVLERRNAVRPVFAHHDARLAFVEETSTGDAIVLLDMATQKESRFETPFPSARWIGFTPDDKRLLTVSSQSGDDRKGHARYVVAGWEIDTGWQLWQHTIGAPSTFNGRPYAISPDGAALAAVLPDGKVEVLETKDGSDRFTIAATEEFAMAVAFSPDSSTLLTGAGYSDSAIQLWDAHSGAARRTLDGHRSWVSDLLFTPDGKMLISSSGDQTIRLWDWTTLRAAGVVRGHLDEVDGLALSPNGRTLVSRCKDGSIYLWDVTKTSRHPGYQTLPGRLDYSANAFTPDGRCILGDDPKGGVGQWDASTLTETRRLPGDLTNETDTIISPDARWVLREYAGGVLRVWDAQTWLEITNFVAAPGHFNGWVTDNGKFLVTLCGPATNNVLEAWNTATWQRTASLTLPFKGFTWAFTTSRPNSFVIATDEALRLYDVSKLDEGPQEFESRGDASGVAISPDGLMVAGAFEDGSVRLWDAGTHKQLESLKGFLLAATAVAFSPDGRRLAASSNGQEAVKVWDTETRQEVLTLSGEGSQFFGLKFSSDGRRLLAINRAGLAHLWSAPTWEEIEAAEPGEMKAAQE
ncbi:MAG TPA: protein kinase [Candidatus Baltobacteraceae bacterium]|jgi:WD40 repeat protein/serine/threonine protein kinase|nr:protein kinase [Candidatus Baltobacteraceae bacterium]